MAVLFLLNGINAKAGSFQDQSENIPENVVQVEANINIDPLKSAAKDGLGPLSLPYLRNSVIGSVHVYDSRQPDLFISGNTRGSDLFLFKWLKNDENGIPIFDGPVVIKEDFYSKGTIFQTKDGAIHGLWLDKTSVKHDIFDTKKMIFIEKEEVALPELPDSPRSIAAYINTDGSVDLIFEVDGFYKPSKYKNNDASSEGYRPYDEAGISSQSMGFTYLYSVHYPKLLSGNPTHIRQVTTTNKEVVYNMTNLAPVNLGEDQGEGLIAGSKMGTFSYYSKDGKKPFKFAERKYVVDEAGNILRHPSVSASVTAYYQSDNNKVADFISGGEGAVYYYKFSGKFTQQGNPIFMDPVPVLQQNADLYAGTLPSPSAVDWDGDGAQDLIVGNSEGFVLFFKNIGNDDEPAFLPGERVQVGGKDIQIQAGYSGSVQGTGEARWGYASPTVVDWTGNGLPDIIMGDITGNYGIFINTGTKNKPYFEQSEPLYYNGIELHGSWRSRAAVGVFDGRKGMAIIDADDEFHLYWQLDDYNLEDGGKLLHNGTPINTSAQPAGGTGRCKLDFFDYDGDGKLDLIIGNGRRSAIPNKKTGYPLPVLGNRTLGTPLFMKNVGTAGQPEFAHPKPFYLEGVGILQPGGSHESGAIGTALGGGKERNLIVGNEAGSLFLLKHDNLRLMEIEEAEDYKNKPNPLWKVGPQELIEPETPKALQETTPPEPTYQNVPYGAHERQVLDFYKAKSTKPTPLVFWIHGGGWTAGSKKNVPFLQDYLNARISVVSINYRYSWQAQLAGVQPPIEWPIADAARALQFVRSKAEEWNIDKKRVAASGSSAGGSSSLYLAFHDDLADPDSSDPIERESTRLLCAGVRHPQTTFDPKQLIEWTPNSRYGGHAFGFMDPNDLKSRDSSFSEFLEKRESVLHWIKMYSAYYLVSKDDPDVYLLYKSPPAMGEPQQDPTHTANYGVQFKEHCEDVGVSCELVYPGATNIEHEDIKDFIIDKLIK